MAPAEGLVMALNTPLLLVFLNRSPQRPHRVANAVHVERKHGKNPSDCRNGRMRPEADGVRIQPDRGRTLLSNALQPLNPAESRGFSRVPHGFAWCCPKSSHGAMEASPTQMRR